MAYGNYTGSQKLLDENMFYSGFSGHVIWTSKGTVDNSPDVNLYMKRPFDNNTQALYVPAGTYGGWEYTAVAFDASNVDHVHVAIKTGEEFSRTAAGGNITLAIAAQTLCDANLTLTPTANTTVQGVEMVISDSDSEELIYVWLDMKLWWVNVNFGVRKTSWFPASGVAALTVAE